MNNRVGTSSGSLSEPTGGITDELGNALLSTDTTGGDAQTLGPQLSREIVFGVPNADFSTLPEDPSEPISETNGIPFYTLIPGDEWGLLAGEHITVEVAPSPVDTPAGVDLSFTVGAGAADNEAVAIERWVPIASDYGGRLAARAKVAAYCDNPGADANDVFLYFEVAYYAADRVTLLDSADSELPFADFTNVDANGTYGAQVDPFLYAAIPLGAAWIRVRVGVRARVSPETTDTEQIHVTGITITRAVPELELTDSEALSTGSGAKVDLRGAAFAIKLQRGDNLPDWSAHEAKLTIDPTPSSPGERFSMILTEITPDGATYSDDATAVATSTTTQLTLNNAPAGTYQYQAPSSNEVSLSYGGGTFLIVARASFESNGTGSFRRLFLYKNGTSLANTILAVGPSAAYTVTVTTVTQLMNGDALSLHARHDATSTLDVTPVELSLIRLGDRY